MPSPTSHSEVKKVVMQAPPQLDDMGGVLDGAYNEVIGGHPEDMNEMPPDTALDSAGSVID
jgi:hypothetical protein